MSFRTVTRLFVLGAVLFLVLAGGLSLYATGFVTELRNRTLAPQSAPTVRAGLIEEIERVLGPRGAGGALREYALTRTPRLLDASARYVATARQAIGLYTDQASSQRLQRGAAELGALFEKINSLQTNAEDLDPAILVGRLEATDAQLASLAGALRQQEVLTRFDGAERITELTRGTIIFVFVGAFVVLLLGALLVRGRVRAPLDAVVRDLEDLAGIIESGAGSEVGVWGLDRRDEIGDLARAVQRLRDTKPGPDTDRPLIAGDGPLKIELSGPSGAMVDQVLESLRDAAASLVERGKDIDTAREEAATRATDEIARLSSAIGEFDSSRHKIEEIVVAQRKEFGTAKVEIGKAVDHIREAGTGYQARFEDTVMSFRKQADQLESVLQSMTRTAERTDAGLAETVTGVGRAQDAISGMLSDAESINAATRDAATALKDRFADAIDDVRAAFERLGETANRVDGEAAGLNRAAEGYRTSLDETYTEISGRLVAAADAIEVTVGRVSTAQEAQDDRLSATQADLRSFGESVAAGISQISKGLAEGNARIEGMEHDLSRMRSSFESGAARPGDTDREPFDDLRQAAESQSDGLAKMIEGMSSVQAAVEALESRLETPVGSPAVGEEGTGATDVSELRGQLEILTRSITDMADRVALLPDLRETIDRLAAELASDGPAGDARTVLSDLTTRFETLQAELGAMAERIALLPDLRNTLEGLASRAEAGSGGVTGDNAIGTKLDDIANGIADGLTEIIAQVGKAVDEQGVTAASISRQQAELRTTLETVTDRIDALATALSAHEGAGAATGDDTNGAPLADGLARIEAETHRLSVMLDGQLTRFEAGTNGLTQAIGASIARTDDLVERLDGFGAVDDSLSGFKERTDTLAKALHDAVSRIDGHLAEVVSALDGRNGSAPSTLPVEDLRQCVEEILLPFAGSAGEDGGDPILAAGVLQDVVSKLGSLTEQMESRGRETEPEMQRIAAIEEAVTGLRADLAQQLEAVARDLTALREANPGGPALGAEAMSALSATIEAEARAILDSLKTGAADSTDTTEPVIASLTDFVRLLKEQGMIEPERDSLSSAAADIDAITDVIDALERRSAQLARRIMEEGVPESDDETAEAAPANAESAISRLQLASEKLGNIATAVAIASDAHRLRAAG